MRLRRYLPILFALSMACGQLANPDLQHGAVTGRVPNAATGAYAYVLGSPELIAPVAADGSFRLDGVPAGAPSIVLFDGTSGAESVAVHVDGASISHVDPGRPLRPAAALTLGCSPFNGAQTTGLNFTVDGTPHRKVKADSGTVRIFPLPAGTFSVTASQPGYQDRNVDVSVSSGGEDSLDIDLAVDEKDDHRGCLSSSCSHGLNCNPADGQCYECVEDRQCGGGNTCTAAHVCSRASGHGELCDACTAAADCEGTGATCFNPTGGVLAGSCTVSCSAVQGCPSGFTCNGNVCAPALSCLIVTATYGATCTDDSTCSSALQDGKCLRPSKKDSSGYCTGKVQAGCPAGFVPDPLGSGYCVKSS